MQIEVNGQVSEITRAENEKLELGKVDVGNLSRHTVMLYFPGVYNSKVHDSEVEAIVAEFWKEAWSAEKPMFTAEEGAWDAGVSADALISGYMHYFMKTFWGSAAVSDSISYLGLDGSADVTYIDGLEMVGSAGSDVIHALLRCSDFDARLFNQRYKEWLENDPNAYGPDNLNGNISRMELEELSPEVWKMLLLCSKPLVAKYGKDVDLEKVFTDFIRTDKQAIKDGIYVLSPSELAAIAAEEA